ncbi:GGDEF domain-containing protein [Aurantimonas sp. HBX-1]|uniref:GGDEF domain-containing protein n=1 Tax=Aurantimonas sp. HBX-1 TaxID=2906072 RepID=UPI001F3B2ED6|nr:GGDEF domain-containing protein [Aurantimonas sp. HBX-1]UIJ72325.1 GGDEF domain-containing protein [Aurantimonas sp. HBX-1]
MHVDAPTMILLTGGIALIAALSLGNEWRRGREPAIGFWSIGFACIAAGSTLSVSRMAGWYLAGIWLPHGLLVMGHACFLAGVAMHVGVRPRPVWLAALLPWAVCYLLPADLGSAPLLVLVNSLTVSVYALACAWLLLRADDGSANQRMLGGLFAFHGLVYAVRAGLVGVEGAFVNLGRFEGFAVSAGLFHGVFVAVLLALLMTSAVRGRRESDLAILAHIDPLTGVYNRRAFLGMSSKALAAPAPRHAAPVAVMLFDLDHFKRLNDTHGHAFGDRVLQEFVATARACLPREAVFARLGGEEFAVFLPRTSAGDASSLGWAIVEAFAGGPGNSAGATVSVGVAAATVAQPVDALVEAADAALYEAKRRGRNRVELVLFEAPPELGRSALPGHPVPAHQCA